MPMKLSGNLEELIVILIEELKSNNHNVIASNIQSLFIDLKSSNLEIKNSSIKLLMEKCHAKSLGDLYIKTCTMNGTI